MKPSHSTSSLKISNFFDSKKRERESDFNHEETKRTKVITDIEREIEQNQGKEKIAIKIIPKHWFIAYPWLCQLQSSALSYNWCTWLGENKDSPFGSSNGSFNFRIKTLEEHQASASHKKAQNAFIQTKTQRGTNVIEGYFSNRAK